MLIYYLNKKKYSEAEPLFIEALKIHKLISKEYPLNLAISTNNLAQFYSAQGKYLKAEPLFAETLVLYNNISGKNNDQYDYARNQLASIYRIKDKYFEAETLYLECVDYARKVYGEEHIDYGIALDNLGLTYHDQGKFLDAEPILNKATTNGYTAKIVNDRYATKTSILNLDGKKNPYVLHLATHGFFFEDVKKDLSGTNRLLLESDINTQAKASFCRASEDPMLRSGLLFAGVNKYWGKPIDKSVLDDGVLTAKEISNLDLSSCELIVLSACETGLGDVRGSEGVYGLQRAFKMAGVKNIIMSLWKVPDAQTAELFDLFYEETFNGKTIQESLRIAQAKMKERYTPYYWAGFVLLE